MGLQDVGAHIPQAHALCSPIFLSKLTPACEPRPPAAPWGQGVGPGCLAQCTAGFRGRTPTGAPEVANDNRLQLWVTGPSSAPSVPSTCRSAFCGPWHGQACAGVCCSSGQWGALGCAGPPTLRASRACSSLLRSPPSRFPGHFSGSCVLSGPVPRPPPGAVEHWGLIGRRPSSPSAGPGLPLGSVPSFCRQGHMSGVPWPCWALCLGLPSNPSQGPNHTDPSHHHEAQAGRVWPGWQESSSGSRRMEGSDPDPASTACSAGEGAHVG